MSVKISSVDAGSPAEKAGIMPGETLVSLDGHKIRDVLDYRFYMMEKKLSAVIEDGGGNAREVHVRKGEYDELGLEFDTYLMDEEHSCRNKCIFCFIDQMPPGMRETLYFKDDDNRLGFLFGNYVTLTNITEEEIDRIIKMRLSPVNVSVHTTNPELRVKMMANPNAASSLKYLKKLADGRIALHTQLVLCPGINDGAELERSLNDLGELWPAVESIAAVPVGLTKYRDGLYPLEPYTKEQAAEVIDIVERFAQRQLSEHGERIAYPADEFFIKAERPFPDAEYYGEFTQLENGVGLAAMLKDEFCTALRDTEKKPAHRRVTIATGCAAYGLMREIAGLAEEHFSGLTVAVVPIRNEFFGENVTVTGLITGTDLEKQLAGSELGDVVLICQAMLRHEHDRFLDDITPQELEHEINAPVVVVENDGEALLQAICGAE